MAQPEMVPFTQARPQPVPLCLGRLRAIGSDGAQCTQAPQAGSSSRTALPSPAQCVSGTVPSRQAMPDDREFLSPLRVPWDKIN